MTAEKESKDWNRKKKNRKREEQRKVNLDCQVGVNATVDDAFAALPGFLKARTLRARQ